MVQTSNPTFLFPNAVSPRYVEPLLLHLQHNQYYSTAQFMCLLRSSGFDMKGKSIALYNMLTWSLAGLGQIEKHGTGLFRKNLFRLTELGKQLIDTYGTNSELFYDLIHFLFYSTYRRSGDVRRGRFWLYASVCDALWQEAPAPIDYSSLTNRLQVECRMVFPGYDPAFSVQSVGGVLVWLQMLAPPFLSKEGARKHRYSARRNHCTPQLFHLATELVYITGEGLQYGSSLAINERHVEAICKACLLDTEHFWRMADLTQMSISGYELRRGQWGTSIALTGPPGWITLPDFSHEKVGEFEVGGEV